MGDSLEVRESVFDDMVAIEALYPKAFPDEDLLPLVKELLRAEPFVLSLVGALGPSLVGHIIFTRCSVPECSGNAALVGPLAVAPAFQRQGIGSALIRAGLLEQERAGATQVYVLGDPAYYGRFAFEQELLVTPPYPLPEEWQGAWQSLSLTKTEPPCHGELSVPQPWQKPALWTD